MSFRPYPKKPTMEMELPAKARSLTALNRAGQFIRLYLQPTATARKDRADLGLGYSRVLDLEPVLAILTIHSGLALGDNPFEVPSADFRKQFLPCALDVLRIDQP